MNGAVRLFAWPAWRVGLYQEQDYRRGYPNGTKGFADPLLFSA
ncbi:hypothetical protein CBM2587_A160164 [Cupriavidus taiwanensis]|uniref:Uncharacterized protein n=1 Tax=Cupriavidus taiwanensis TaxID=164546 RepID=A0A375BIU4_9BURK|nr:hypothetical protein CBM2587_A160164 [Cupriavidus taiwanensis]